MGSNSFKKGEKFSFEKSIDYADDSVVSKQILKKKSGNVTLFAFEKGEGLSEHTAPFDAMVSVVEGQAEVLIDGVSSMVASGESIIMPAGIPHALKAPERFKMVLTMIKEITP